MNPRTFNSRRAKKIDPRRRASDHNHGYDHGSWRGRGCRRLTSRCLAFETWPAWFRGRSWSGDAGWDVWSKGHPGCVGCTLRSKVLCTSVYSVLVPYLYSKCIISTEEYSIHVHSLYV